MADVPPIYNASQGLDAVIAFIDDDWSAVMVKVISGSDPVEFLPEPARALAHELRSMADALDAHDAVGT